MKNVIAVIVTYNVGISFLESIEVLSGKVDEIVVIDNGSNKNTLKILDTLKNTITLIALNENKGIAYALNRGIKYGIEKGYEWILTLDHDSIIEENMIRNMLETYEGIEKEDKDKIVMITPVHIEESQYKKEGFKKEYSWQYVLTEITSGSLTKSSYYKEHLYDESLFIDLVDHDFCLDINKKEYKIIQVKSAGLIHNLGESKKKKIVGIEMTPTNHNPIRRYYMARNRFYIWEKYRKDFPEWITTDKKRFVSELAKIVLFEDNKFIKFKMTFKGMKDYKSGIKGPYINNSKLK